jgi:hypothetical protein
LISSHDLVFKIDSNITFNPIADAAGGSPRRVTVAGTITFYVVAAAISTYSH